MLPCLRRFFDVIMDLLVQKANSYEKEKYQWFKNTTKKEIEFSSGFLRKLTCCPPTVGCERRLMSVIIFLPIASERKTSCSRAEKWISTNLSGCADRL